MALSSGIIAGIAAAFAWGFADFLAKVAIDRLGKGGDMKALFWTRLASLLPIFLLLLLPLGLQLPPALLPILFLLGIFDFFGWWFFYRGLSKGNVSIVSPIAGSYSAVTVLLGLLVIGERLGVLQLLGVAAVIAGVALASTDLSRLRKAGARMSAGAGEAMVAMVGWGVMWAGAGVLSGQIGWLLTTFGVRVTTFLLASGYSAGKRLRLAEGLSRNLLLLMLVAGIFDTLGYFLTAWAMGTELISIVAPISASFPAVTVLLALYFLRERLVPNQMIGIIVILAGIIALAI